MSENSPKLGLPYIQPAQAQKHVTHNQAIETLDAVTQLVVDQFGAETPPSLPVAGETYALGAAPTGDWAGHPNQIAFHTGTGWLFLPPLTGWRAWGKAEQDLRVWDGAAWALVAPPIETLDKLGINATADATNRLSVASDAVLLNNAGAGHQLKINKATGSDTASVLFQSGWSGHAEMGLAGDTNFTLKVSADGGTWITPLTVDPTAQTLSLAPAGTPTVTAGDGYLNIDAPITGTAVQAHATDTTAGRLMPVGAFGLGAPGASLADIDVLDGSIAPGLYQISGATAGAPRSTGAQHLLHSRRGPSSGETQLVMAETDGSLFFRARDSGAWQPWQQVATSAQLTGDFNDPERSPVFERGTNANGDYTRFADGTQFCWHAVTLDYSWARELFGSWTYPAAFVSPAKVFVTLEYFSLDATTPGVDAVSTATVEGASSVGAYFRLMRAAGQADFVAGDSVTLTTLAFGRWK